MVFFFFCFFLIRKRFELAFYYSLTLQKDNPKRFKNARQQRINCLNYTTPLFFSRELLQPNHCGQLSTVEVFWGPCMQKPFLPLWSSEFVSFWVEKWASFWSMAVINLKIRHLFSYSCNGKWKIENSSRGHGYVGKKVSFGLNWYTSKGNVLTTSQSSVAKTNEAQINRWKGEPSL